MDLSKEKIELTIALPKEVAETLTKINKDTNAMRDVNETLEEFISKLLIGFLKTTAEKVKKGYGQHEPDLNY